MFKPFQINLCCPGKPKKSLDYIINWIDSASVTLNQLSSAVLSLQTWKDSISTDIENAIDAAVAEYDWSQVSEFNTLQEQINDLNSALNEKVTKIIPSTLGNLASLDTLGNLLDSGKKASDFAIAGHTHDFVGLEVDSSSYEGLVVRGKKYYPCVLTEQEADGEVTHYNTYICTGSIDIRALDGITIEGPGDYTLEIETEEQMQNLKNATITPDSVPSLNSGRLITSGAVYSGLSSKAALSTVTDIQTVNNNQQRLLRELVRRTDVETFNSLVPGGNGNWQMSFRGHLYSESEPYVIAIEGNTMPNVGEILCIIQGTGDTYTTGIPCTVIDKFTGPNRIVVSQDVSSKLSEGSSPGDNIYIWLWS